MKNVLIKGLALAFVGSLAMSSSAMAVPIVGSDLQNFFDAKSWELDADADQMNNVAGWSLTTASSASNMTLYYENPANTVFGIYSFLGGEKAVVFDSVDSPVASATVTFLGVDALVVQMWDANNFLLDVDNYTFTGETFGFYLEVGGFTYYSDSGMNDLNHNGIYGEDEDVAMLVYNAAPGSYVFAGDLDGDRDFFDSVTQAESVAPVPEPATMLLFGSGLVGLAGYGRKKIAKK